MMNEKDECEKFLARIQQNSHVTDAGVQDVIGKLKGWMRELEIVEKLDDRLKKLNDLTNG